MTGQIPSNGPFVLMRKALITQIISHIFVESASVRNVMDESDRIRVWIYQKMWSSLKCWGNPPQRKGILVEAC